MFEIFTPSGFLLTATLARPKSQIFRSQVVLSNKLLGFRSLMKKMFFRSLTRKIFFSLMRKIFFSLTRKIFYVSDEKDLFEVSDGKDFLRSLTRKIFVEKDGY